MTELELDEVLNCWKAPEAPASLRERVDARLPRPLLSRRVFRWTVAAAGVAVCALVGASDFATSALGVFSASWDVPSGAVYVKIEHRIDPPISPFSAMSYGGGGFAGQDASGLHGGSFAHNGHGIYYAYAYNLQLAGNGQFSLSFSALDPAELQRMVQPLKVTGALQSPSELPPPQGIALGQPVEITLAETGGERIYDRITFSSAAPPWPQQRNANVLQIEDPKVYIEGKLAAEDTGFSASGATIWLHVPGQGRYLIALDPQANARFTLAGTVEGATLRFNSDGVEFRIDSAAPIAAGDSHPVFVYHQRSFEDSLDASGAEAKQVLMGSAGPASIHQ